MGAGADSFGCGFCRAGAVGFTAWGAAVSSANLGLGFGTPWAHGAPAPASDTLDISPTIAGKSATQSICGSGRGISLISCVKSHAGRMWGAAGVSSGRRGGTVPSRRKTVAIPAAPIAILVLRFICRISLPHNKTTVLLEEFLRRTVALVMMKL